MRFLAGFAVVVRLVSAVDVKYAQSAEAVPNASASSHLKRRFVSPHEELYHDLRRRGTKWNVIREYSSDVFTGAAVQLGSDSDLVKLVKAQGVQSVTPNYLHPPPEAVLEYATTRKAKRAVPEGVVSAHAMTGVDKLHAEGYSGRGIKIIDSGVDYTHPALGGGFGPGHKIVGGYDFVGDACTGRPGGPPPAPDSDPLDQCSTHGNHVAGIIGANPNSPHNIPGVAYESEINAYRIYGCEGSTSEHIVIAALLREDEENDIITLSTAAVHGWTKSVSAVVASRIAERGKIVTVSAGNDGASGAWHASSTGTGRSVIAAAFASNGHAIAYLSLEPLRIPAGRLVYATSYDLSVEADACHALPTNTPNLSNRLVLIRTGSCPLITKFDNAAVHGAKYFLVFDKDDESLAPIDASRYIAAMISQSDGLFLLQQAIPHKYTISFPNSPSTFPVPTGRLMSSSSRYGPSYDMFLKPTLAAPGGFIVSTIPVTLGSWGIRPGTSQATPFVAGSAALLLQARGNNAHTKKAARAIFQNTASPVRTSANSALLATASHQGDGLINVYNAPPSAGDTLKLHNGGGQPVTYILRHVPAGTALTVNGINGNSGPVPLVSGPAVVTISPSEITLPAGRTRSIAVTFKPPTGLDPTTFPVLPTAAKLRDAGVLDNTNNYLGYMLPSMIDGEGRAIPPEGAATYTMHGSDVPFVTYRLVQGTPYLRIDLIDSHAHVATNRPRSSGTEEQFAKLSKAVMDPHSALSKRTFLDCFTSGGAKTCTGTTANIKTLGMLYAVHYIPRHGSDTANKANGYSSMRIIQFANGTTIPDGSYRVLLRALRITGNRQKLRDYDIWTSPEFVIKRA